MTNQPVEYKVATSVKTTFFSAIGTCALSLVLFTIGIIVSMVTSDGSSATSIPFIIFWIISGLIGLSSGILFVISLILWITDTTKYKEASDKQLK